jgi:uncharacterized protein (DUF885 family)
MTNGGAIDRRFVLAGLAATALPGFTDRPPDTAGLALDEAATLSPAEGLARLASLDLRPLSTARRLDVASARAGLAIDAALASRPDDIALHLRRTLGGRIDPAAATRRLDAALAGLHARAVRLFDRVGIAGVSIGARYERLFAERAGHYPEADGRAAAVADMTRALAAFRTETPRLIADVPPFCLDVAVRTLSAAEIAAGKQGYREVPAPGRPGTYVVDLRDLSRRPAWSLPSVVAHELLPGHMVQLGIEEAAAPHPLRLRYASAFVEGWATYAETLVAYPDPRAMLGHLHWLIFRAARGRVDLGIHHDGWSPAMARARLAEWQGEPVYFAAFDADVARIVREPGVRAAEALAWLGLADRAPRSAATRRRWHAEVLANGRKRLENLP